MTLIVAKIMTDGQVFQMAVTPFAQGLDVLQGRGSWLHVFTADPTRHHAVHLASHRFINFVTRVGEFAHVKQCTSDRPLKREFRLRGI